MASLRDIAKQIGGLTVANAPQSLKGSKRRRPGNLKRALKRENTSDNILKVNPKTKSFSFEINYAPPGAEYGMFWNDPTVSKTVRNAKTNNIPESINFAEKALYSPIVDSMLNDYMDEIGAMVVEEISKAIDDLK
jgi:hypothetical protein